VVVLQTAEDGLLRTKVEPDVMAYILYCHYEDFAKIQQVRSQLYVVLYRLIIWSVFIYSHIFL